MELLDRIYSKTGGFMKGICWPENDLTLLSGCGIGWVRWDVPYPFEEDGSPTNGLIAYRDRCRYFASAGIRTVAISPYPKEFISRGMDVSTPSGLDAAEKVCEKMADFLSDCVGCWQVSNELMFNFRAPLSMDQIVPFLASCARGIRRGAPDTLIGTNSTPPWDPVGCANFDALNELLGKDFLDYCGFDVYFGSWIPGGPKDYDIWTRRLYEYAKTPLILMEFGFSSKGTYYTDEKWNRFLKKYGFENEDDMVAHPDRFFQDVLEPLAPPLARTLRRMAPSELGPELRASKMHLLKCWSTRGKIPHTEKGQAKFYSQLLPMLMEIPSLAGAMIYDNRDSERCFSCGSPDCPLECGWGLLRSDGTPKPAYDVVRDCWAK